MADDTAMRHVRITQDELFAEAKARFGDNIGAFAFACPTCGDVATLAEWKTLGDSDRAGQDCVGRVSSANRKAAGIDPDRGCDWCSYGLFRGPWEIMIPTADNSTRSVWGFPLAGKPAADGPVSRFLAANPLPERAR